MTSTRTLLDVDLELSALSTTHQEQKWHKDRKVRVGALTPEARAAYYSEMNRLLDERNALRKASQ